MAVGNGKLPPPGPLYRSCLDAAQARREEEARQVQPQRIKRFLAESDTRRWSRQGDRVVFC